MKRDPNEIVLKKTCANSEELGYRRSENLIKMYAIFIQKFKENEELPIYISTEQITFDWERSDTNWCFNLVKRPISADNDDLGNGSVRGFGQFKLGYY